MIAGERNWPTETSSAGQVGREEEDQAKIRRRDVQALTVAQHDLPGAGEAENALGVKLRERA